jgi:hypothetical protein
MKNSQPDLDHAKKNRLKSQKVSSEADKNI